MPVATEHPDRPSRRQAVLALLSGSLSALGLETSAARTRKKKKCKKPERCPVRTACGCSDNSCAYLPFTGDDAESDAACAAHCSSKSGVASRSTSTAAATAVCLLSGAATLASCPLF